MSPFIRGMAALYAATGYRVMDQNGEGVCRPQVSITVQNSKQNNA